MGERNAAVQFDGNTSLPLRYFRHEKFHRVPGLNTIFGPRRDRGPGKKTTHRPNSAIRNPPRRGHSPCENVSDSCADPGLT
jgi:hypothetical protein